MPRQVTWKSQLDCQLFFTTIFLRHKGFMIGTFSLSNVYTYTEFCRKVFIEAARHIQDDKISGLSGEDTVVLTIDEGEGRGQSVHEMRCCKFTISCENEYLAFDSWRQQVFNGGNVIRARWTFDVMTLEQFGPNTVTAEQNGAIDVLALGVHN